MYQVQSDNEEALQQLKKRRNLFTILFVCALVLGGTTGAIPVVGWYISIALLILAGFFAGVGMLCINCYRYTITNGAKQGGGLWWALLFIFGFFIVPLITVVIVRNIRPLAEKLLGVEFL